MFELKKFSFKRKFFLRCRIVSSLNLFERRRERKEVGRVGGLVGGVRKIVGQKIMEGKIFLCEFVGNFFTTRNIFFYTEFVRNFYT